MNELNKSLINKDELQKLISSNLKKENFNNGLIEVYKNLGKFEEEEIDDIIDGNVFFTKFYKLVTDSSDGIFAQLAKEINDKLLYHCSNITYWLNYNTHLTSQNLPELQNSHLVKANRLINTITPAYLNKNEDNDLSVVCFKNMIEGEVDKPNPQIFSIHKILVEAKEYKSFIHSYKSAENKMFITADGLENDFDIDHDGLVEQINSLLDLNEHKINQGQLNNYKIFLQHIFEIDNTQYPDYLDDSKKSKIQNFTINKIQPFRHYYIYNLSYPYSNYRVGSLMIFSDALLGENFQEFIVQIREVINAVKQVEHRYLERRKLFLLKQNQLKTAIISILIDSYAHNISAHSLAALKWWIELRYKMLDKRFYISEDKKGLTIKNLFPDSITITQDLLKDTTEKYYETLGLTDSKYNKEFYSLFDYLQFAPEKALEDIFAFKDSNEKLINGDDKKNGIVSYTSKKEKEENSKAIKAFFPRFPVPIDYALYPFFRFLRDKGAFWSGVTRDTAYGGESKTWHQILWEDFANNPLYLGTIAKSEKISKVNINLAVKTEDGWIKGRFVTIDMSIIDEEDRTIPLDDCSLKEKGEIKKEDCNFNVNCSVEYSKYSKYAFVKLGGCFKAFREELSNDKYNVFLPGGLIGEHALFTIFENTLRNIKHYKDETQLKEIRTNGIDFWISIDDERLSFQENTKIKPELFKVSVWLEHKTDLVKFDEKNEIKECLWKKVTDSTLNPILDDNGVPRMGGNSQDKACAAMLFNNKFISVESKEGEKISFYYPWIHFTTNTTKNHYNSNYDFPKTRIENHSYYSANEESSKIFVKDYVTKLKKLKVANLKKLKEGYLKKYFYLWRSEDYLQIKNHSDLIGENVSRFKFVILSDKIEGKERVDLINEIRENGIIRLLYKKDDLDSFSSKNLIDKLEEEIPDQFAEEENPTVKILKINNERLKTLYHIWLKDWLKYKDNFNVGFKKDSKTWAVILIDKNNPIFSYHRKNDEAKINAQKSYSIDLILSHGGNDENDSCNVRSHGYFWGKYFVNAPNKDPQDLENSDVYDRQKEYLLMDFVEVIATRIEIFDNRINLRMEQLDKIKRKKVFGEFLRLSVYEEKIDNDKDKSAAFKERLKVLNSNNEPLILIIHLSYIEAMDYTEENINLFIKDHLEELFNNKENFIFVLTSGRGRDAWKKHLDVKYRKQTIFKPVESLIGAVESGLSYNDNFDVKYNLIKVIFGS